MTAENDALRPHMERALGLVERYMNLTTDYSHRSKDFIALAVGCYQKMEEEDKSKVLETLDEFLSIAYLMGREDGILSER